MSPEGSPRRGGQRPDTGAGRVGLLLCAMAAMAIVLMVAAAVSMARAEQRPPVPRPPMSLPAPGSAAGASGAERGSANGMWLVGAEPGPAAARIARAFGAERLSPASGTFRVRQGRARELAERLQARGLLAYAEPDVAAISNAYPTEPPPGGLVGEQWWLQAITKPAWTTPPEVLSTSPELAILEDSLDSTHPEFQGSALVGGVSVSGPKDEHGTAIASIAGAPANGTGIVGTWPGMRMRLVRSGSVCSTTTEAVYAAVASGVAVLNMSYSFPADSCFTHFMATQHAISKGVIPVAAAGNNYVEGNQPLRPATDPHVITVAAVEDPTFTTGETYAGFDPGNLRAADFSSRSDSNDISAPGVRVVAAVPRTTAESGYAYVSGTSFAAPMVSAAAAWIKAERPALEVDQIAAMINQSAVDLGPKGHDDAYGWGLLDIDAAVARPAPRPDPMEPNDDIEWVNGSRLDGPAPFLYPPSKPKAKGRKGKKAKAGSIQAQLSELEDPADVYRIRMAPRQRLTITAKQQRGDLVLEAFRPKARSIYELGGARIARSDRRPGKPEVMRIRNLTKRPRLVYVALVPSTNSTQPGAAYKLTVKP